MRTTFICLANSRKYGERCVAGIEIQSDPQAQQYQIVKNGDIPNWVRPVMENDFGQLPETLVSTIGLLDVISIHKNKGVPNGCHRENVLFEPNSIELHNRLAPTIENLEALTLGAPLTLFGNRGKSVSVQTSKTLNYSLLFIKAYDAKFYTNRLGNQLRVRFTYNSNDYDFPVTDLEFCKLFNDNPQTMELFDEAYFTLSLSTIFEEWYYKLVAGVCIPNKQQ
jgi:hypothetical protein